MAYWTLEDLQDRLSRETVINCFDDDDDGEPDDTPIERLQVDSDSFVEGYLRGNYDLDAVRAAPPNQVVRLSLDYAEAMTAKRHPAYVKRDWVPMMAMVKADLADIRAGKIRLDVVGTPEPAANNGGTDLGVRSESTGERVRFFTGSGSLGDF